MAKDYTLTLSGVAQQLSSVFANQGVNLPKDDIPCKQLAIQPDAGASAVMYLGGSSLVTSTLYGVLLNKPVGSVPPAPYVIGPFATGSVKLSDYWIIGTANDKVHFLLTPY